MVPIQVRAQALRGWSPVDHTNGLAVFVAPEREDCQTEKGLGHQRGRWRQSDVRRAIAAAEQAGLQSYRVELAPDGTISIIVGAPEETADPGREAT